MKRTLSILLVLTLVLGFVLGAAAAPKEKPPTVTDRNATLTLSNITKTSVTVTVNVKKPALIATPPFDMQVRITEATGDDWVSPPEPVSFTVPSAEPFSTTFSYALDEYLRAYSAHLNLLVGDVSNIVFLYFSTYEMTTVITQSPKLAVAGQPLTLTAKTFLDGSELLGDEWYYEFETGYYETGTGWLKNGYRVNELTIESMPAKETCRFDYTIVTADGKMAYKRMFIPVILP